MAPATGGNGLAMRIARFVEAAQGDFDVVVTVVPVGGRPPGPALAVPTAVALPTGEPAGPALAALLVDPEWRRRIAAAAPFPRLVGPVPPTMAGVVVRAAERLGVVPGTPVHVVRSHLAPVGLAVAERLGSPWVTLDLDDDDEAFMAETGDADEAAAYRRLVGAFGPAFAGLAAASGADAAALSDRHGLDVSLLPNTVELPSRRRAATERAPDLLFVGNLTYAPNVAAAHVLVERLLPLVRARSGLPVTATVAGAYLPGARVGRLADLPDVRLLGFVDDLQPLYDQAAVALVPLPAGSGTKIKLLEAFAQQLPVVTTPAGAAGLGVEPGVHLLVGEDDEALVAHTLTLLSEPAAGDRLAAAAFDFVRRNHTPEATQPLVPPFSARPRAVISGPGPPGRGAPGTSRSLPPVTPRARTPRGPRLRSRLGCGSRRRAGARPTPWRSGGGPGRSRGRR